MSLNSNASLRLTTLSDEKIEPMIPKITGGRADSMSRAAAVLYTSSLPPREVETLCRRSRLLATSTRLTMATVTIALTMRELTIDMESENPAGRSSPSLENVQFQLDEPRAPARPSEARPKIQTAMRINHC
jgi:hypothetical protein